MDTNAPALIDGRPYLPRNDANPISQAERLRDELYDQLTAICHDAGVDALLAKSPPYSPTVWVRVEIWRHVQARTDVAGRGWAVLTIDPKPFHRFPQEVHLEYEVCGRKRKAGPLVPPTGATLRALVDYLGGWAARPRLALNRMRVQNWQLHRPRNRVDGVRRDFLMYLSWALIALGIYVLFTTVAFGFRTSPVLIIAAGTLGLVYRLHEPRLVLSTGRPQQEPRRLLRMDSWQSVLRGVAAHADEFRSRLVHELEASRPAEAYLAHEDIWYWGVDGKEERQQLVVTFRRAVGFLHVYAYHRDLYVGWDVHVNAGTWQEKVVADGIDRSTGRRVVAHSIASGWHVPNEYDVTDANYLSEWIHAVVVERVKEAREEYRIAQEIDFQILREERRAVVGARENDAGKKPGGARRALFRRVG